MKTGTFAGADTDANVFIIIYGSHGDTGKEVIKIYWVILIRFFSTEINSSGFDVPVMIVILQIDIKKQRKKNISL